MGDLPTPTSARQMVFVPGGTRDFITWSAPLISRTDPAKAKDLRPRLLRRDQIDGYIGNGTFVWPTT